MRSFTIPSILALASLTSAIPKPEQWEGPWDGVIDPWGEFGTKPENVPRSNVVFRRDGDINIAGETFTLDQIRDAMVKVKKRDSVAEYPGNIPGCDSDPSAPGTPIPGWHVKKGYKIPKNGDDDECTTGKRGDHCWTEYRLVEGAVEYFDWQQAGSAVHCSADAKASCSVALGDTQNVCTTTGKSISEGFDAKLAEGSISGTFKFGDKGDVTLGYSGGYTKTHSEVDSSMTQVCKMTTTAVTCTWTNGEDAPKELCHQPWYADRVMHVWGQAQRVCNKCKEGANVQQNTGDGNVCVRGQKEFDFRLPINRLVNCNGACDGNESGLPKPANGQRGEYVPPV
ncbi:hypothetical protein V8F06_007119 [Rhypophila decipiens]